MLTIIMPDKKLNLRVHIKNAIKFYAWLYDLEKTIYKLNSHQQNKRNLKRYFNFSTSARAFKC